MKKEKFIPFMSPVICIIIGVLAFVTADQALQMICYVVSGVLILTGLLSVIRYLIGTPEENFASNGFMSGCILLLLGIAVAVQSDAIIKFIPYFLGLLIAVNGVRELQNAIDVYKLGLSRQWIVVVTALINLILGIVLIVNPGLATDMLMKVSGIGLIISGIADFVTTFVVLRMTSKQDGSRARNSRKEKKHTDEPETESVFNESQAIEASGMGISDAEDINTDP